MYAFTENQLAAHLDHIIDRIQHIREMDLSTDANLQTALQESQDTLGALALYRKMLSRAAHYEKRTPRPAA